MRSFSLPNQSGPWLAIFQVFWLLLLALLVSEMAEANLPQKVNQSNRPEGGWFQFDLQNGVYVTRANLPGTLERLTQSGRLSGWRYRTAVDTIEDFDADGRLLSVRNRAGLTHTLSYDVKKRPITVTDSYGRTLRFSYDADSGYLESLIEASNRSIRYAHDADGNLTRVTYPDTSTKQYHFEDINHRFALTGITDERGIRVTNWQYNSDGKVKRYARAGGVDVHLFSYVGNITTVTDPLGTLRTYTYQLINDRPYMTQVTQPCSSCGSDASAQTYDSRGLIASQTDFRGNVTRFERDARALVTSVTQAQGTPVARTQTATYETQWHLPKRIVEPITAGSRITEMAYDAEGNPLETKITVGSEVRTTTRTFNGNGQALTEDGPRTDVADSMTMTYDASGNLATKTDAVGHIWRYTLYDADGQLKSMTDPNGLVTTYAYDARLRLKSMTEGKEVTAYDYDNSGNLTKVTLADGSFLTYQFDDADRLIGVIDTRGQKMVYTLNGNGDRIKEETFGTGNSLAMTMSRVIDNLGRVEKQFGANANEVTTYTYDPSGNEKTTLDPNQNLVKNDYDALDRLTQVIDPNDVPVGFKYDPQDNLLEVSDPRQLKTSYGYSGFDELTKLTSPDTGIADYSYDLSGNLKTRKDARNITATYQYDALNRIRQISYPATTAAKATPPVTPAHVGVHGSGAAATPSAPAETIAFSYDEASGGAGAKGRLTTVTDASGNTKYLYDNHGRVTSKSQVVGTESAKTQTMSYLPTGQLDQHTLPSGAVVKYSYRADGRVVSIQVNGVTIVSELDYFPFGALKSYKYNAADRYVRAFDSNGRVKEHTAGDRTRTIGFDPGSRITSIADGAGSANQWTYGYDTLDRLKTAENTATTGSIANTELDWTFDATGNRLSEARGTPAVTTSYTIDPVSNKLAQLGTAARTYDSVGNTLADGQIASLYSARNRLVQTTKNGTTTTYAHNAFGERVAKRVSGNLAQFVYDDDGHLLGDYRSSDSTEVVWLEDVPVAVIKPSASTQAGIAAGDAKVYVIHADHLDTPRVIVNAANQAVWRWDSAPFGDTAVNEQPTASLAAFQFSLRFPGQQFDVETGSHYNYFRDYEAGTGRYLQADPIGLLGGNNTFGYVGASPIQGFDPLGLNRDRFSWPTGLPEQIKKSQGDCCDKCGCKLAPTPRGKGGEPWDLHHKFVQWFELRDLVDKLFCLVPNGFRTSFLKKLNSLPGNLVARCKTCHEKTPHRRGWFK